MKEKKPIKVRPLFTKLVTTAEMFKEYETVLESGIIDPSKVKVGIKEYQKVIAVGDAVRNINVGDIVCINPDRYAVRKYEKNSLKNDLMENVVVGYKFKFIELGDERCMLLDNSDIEYVVEKFEQ